MLENILYVLVQLFLIGLYSILVVIAFGIVIILILVIVKVVFQTLYGKDR